MEKPSLRDSGDPGRRSINDFVRRAAALAPAGARVLDAGAGECIYRPLFEGRRYVSTDRGVGDSGWDYTELDALADLERIPFRDRSFDVVLCTETLEHVARPGPVLTELGRVLRPGGTLALSVPFLHPVHQAPHVLDHGIAGFRRLGQAGVAALAERNGIRAVNSGVAQSTDRARDGHGIGRVIARERQGGTGGRADADDVGGRKAMEHGAILRPGDAFSRLDQRV